MKLILFAITLLVALFAIYHGIYLVMTCLIGIGIGVLMAPILSKLKKRWKIPRFLSGILYMVFIVAILAGVFWGVSALVSGQLQGLVERAPELANTLEARVSNFLDDHNWSKQQFEKLEIGSAGQKTAKYLLSGLHSSFSALSGLVFILVIGLYTAISLNEYFKSVVQAFPESRRSRAKDILEKCAKTLRQWFTAQLTDMLILGAMVAVGLWIVGIKYWAVYGLLTAALAIIPYIGALVVVVIASLITLASNPEAVPWVLLVFFIAQQIEGNFVLPRLMKDQVELPVVPLLIFMLCLGEWLGIIGIFIAPPFFAMLKVLYKEIYLPKMEQA